MESWQSARARLAVNVRHHGQNSEQAAAARQALRAARAEARIRELDDSGLSAEQRTQLAVRLLQPLGPAA